MSLKAKLEAVIYAAEEPVTLNQLAVLFSEEALEWRAEQENAAAQARASAPTTEPLPFINKDFDYLELGETNGSALVEVGPETAVEPTAESIDTSGIEPVESSSPESGPETETQAGENSAEVSLPQESSHENQDATPETNPEETAKQAARQREREVRLILRELLDELVHDYANDGSGIEIREIAGGFRMGTKPEYHDAVRAFVKSLKPAMKLSLPALETLAVIAYKQPVTAPEVNEIRGVDSSGVFGSLLARKLIATAGRKPVVGRPILYKTTKEFLMRFGLKELGELPSMEEFEKMAASEFEESEAASTEAETPAAEESEQESSVENADNRGAGENSDEPIAAEPAPDSGPAPVVATVEAQESTLE
jgi:segregation and condensation protein B